MPGHEIAHATAVVAAAVRGPLGPGASPPLKAKLAVSLQSGIMRLVATHGHGTKLETQLISLPTLSSHIAVVGGRCGPGQAGGPGGPGGPV